MAVEASSSAWQHFNLGNHLQFQGRLAEAVVSYHTALNLAPSCAEAHNNLGNTLQMLGKHDEAVEHFYRALELQPDLPEAHYNLANGHLARGEVEQAIRRYETVLGLRPHWAEAHFNLSLALLLGNQLVRGWAEYEWRWSCANIGLPGRAFAEPRWQGDEQPDARVLLWAEQGFGDTLQFVRYARQVKARVGHVILECQPELVRILEGVAGVDAIVPAGTPLPSFDLQAPLLSLPYVLRTTDYMGHVVPYLVVPQRLMRSWSRRVGSHTDDHADVRVGLVWAGLPTNPKDRYRSIPPAVLGALAGVLGVSFFGLQKPVPGAFGGAPPDGLRVIDFALCLTDFAETAGLLTQLDLLVSADTSVAHLAGALGLPTWLLLPYVPNWRWGMDIGEATAWYPSFRVFRQTTPGDWEAVIRRVAQCLRTFVLLGQARDRDRAANKRRLRNTR